MSGDTLREAQLRALLDVLPEPVVVHERGRIVTANPAFAALLAVDSVDELVGHFALEFVHPDDLDFVKARLDSTLKNRRTPEHRLVDRRGQAIPVEVTGVPFPYGEEVVALAIVHDLRERKRIEAELAATERLASLGRIASAVGHEINNPLTYMIGALDLLRADLAALGFTTGDALGRVDIAREGAERIRDIVGDLKALSSPRDGVVDAIDLHRVLDAAVSTATHEIAHRARLVRDYGELQPVSGSERRLVQVFVNLLVNAAQAIPDGDVGSNEIRVATRMLDADHVVVEVSDTGAGLPVDRAHLFEPFFTTKSGGTGLGLSIAHRIVAASGGTLAAEARVPRGATFRVCLPVSAQPVLSRRPMATTPPKRRARVLFADDEPMICRLARELLAPHDVVTVASGRDAIDLLEAEPFDVVICDLQMPELGGVDVYDWIVARKPELAARIAFTTGGVFTERARQFVGESAHRVIDKPLDLESVHRIVDEILAIDES